MDHLANIAKGYESRVGVALQQQRQEEADKVMAALHAREKAEEERQRAEAETRRLKAKKDLNYNIAMIEKRQQEKEQERLAAIELRRRLEQEALDAKRQDRVAAEERRLKHIELKYNLDRQLDQLHERQRKEKAGQSDAELSMNKVGSLNIHYLYIAYIFKVKTMPLCFMDFFDPIDLAEETGGRSTITQQGA